MTKHRASLLCLILIAFFLRVWQLPQSPPGLWYDEAYNAMDALWMAKTGQYQLFFVGNNGREPMWHYLLMGSITLLGNIPLAVHWVGALVGVITVPILYRFALSLARPYVGPSGHVRWLALVAAGWLAVSWWAILISRTGLRPVLLPPLLMLSLYFFWQGWQLSVGYRPPDDKLPAADRSPAVADQTGFPLTSFVLAGLFMGLGQYTYLPARLLPLLFGLVAILWTFQARKLGRNKDGPGHKQYAGIRRFWLGVLITAGVSLLVFAPLGLFFLNNPDSFSSRTGDVAFSPDSPGAVAGHLLRAATLFVGAGHELHRHHLPGRAMLGWLEIPFFWLGLVYLLGPKQLRRPETQLILPGLVVMWLPAILASPPVHSLRPIGVLPFYYLVVAVGLWIGGRFLGRVLARVKSGSPVSRVSRAVVPLLFALVIGVNGLINTFDYVWRWSRQPEVYMEFNGPLVDLIQYVSDATRTGDVIIPFHLYAHPTARYLLHNDFSEVPSGLSPPGGTGRPVKMLIVPDTFQLLYVGNIPTSPALVWLTRDGGSDQGQIFVSRPPRAQEQVELDGLLGSLQAQAEPFRDDLGRTVGYFLPLAGDVSQATGLQAPFSSLFNTTPLRATDLDWANLARLRGYDVTPEVIRPGQPIVLNLYWGSLGDNSSDDRLFLQIVDAAGQPINQWEGDAFSEDMSRWRPDQILPTQHTLWVGPDTPPGAYLIRLGFFDRQTGERIPVQVGRPGHGPAGDVAAAGDQVYLGLFYVSPDGSDPRAPARPSSINFDNVIRLVGTTLPDLQDAELLGSFEPESDIEVTFHWQVQHPTDRPYTVFLQLLNDQGELISSWDREPFGGLYPTNRWSPGEVVVDTIALPLPEEGLPAGTYRLITGFYDFDSGQRLPVVGAGDAAELVQFEVGSQ